MYYWHCEVNTYISCQRKYLTISKATPALLTPSVAVCTQFHVMVTWINISIHSVLYRYVLSIFLVVLCHFSKCVCLFFVHWMVCAFTIFSLFSLSDFQCIWNESALFSFAPNHFAQECICVDRTCRCKFSFSFIVSPSLSLSLSLFLVRHVGIAIFMFARRQYISCALEWQANWDLLYAKKKNENKIISLGGMCARHTIQKDTIKLQVDASVPNFSHWFEIRNKTTYHFKLDICSFLCIYATFLFFIPIDARISPLPATSTYKHTQKIVNIYCDCCFYVCHFICNLCVPEWFVVRFVGWCLFCQFTHFHLCI